MKVLITFPLNPQTNSMAQITSVGGEGKRYIFTSIHRTANSSLIQLMMCSCAEGDENKKLGEPFTLNDVFQLSPRKFAPQWLPGEDHPLLSS